MTGIRYFYDIPVYRVDREKYGSDMEKYIGKNLNPGSGALSSHIERMYERNPKLKTTKKAQLADSFGGQWQFNEIIGYLRLHFLGSQIRGEYHSVSKKRIVKTRTKQFEYQTWKLADEIDVPVNADNKLIYNLILTYLKECKKELKGRYIDTKLFETIGEYVNWKRLYKKGPTKHSSGPEKASGR